jgi:hypothetical protein
VVQNQTKPAEVEQKKDDQEETKEPKEDTPKGKRSIKKLLAETDTSLLVSQFISREDGLNHLLLSDVNRLMNDLAEDFPD